MKVSQCRETARDIGHVVNWQKLPSSLASGFAERIDDGGRSGLLCRQAKQDDASYVAFRQYFAEHLPGIMSSAKTGGHSEAMRDYLRGSVCERRETLLGSALLLKQLAEQPLDAATLEAAGACMTMLPPAVRI